MVDIDLIRIVDVDYIKDYTMDLKFSNGETRRIDFLPLLKGNKREELKDMNIIFPIHPRTKKTLENFNLFDEFHVFDVVVIHFGFPVVEFSE